MSQLVPAALFGAHGLRCLQRREVSGRLGTGAAHLQGRCSHGEGLKAQVSTGTRQPLVCQRPVSFGGTQTEA